MASPDFNIPVANGAYAGSDRAKSAMRTAKAGTPLVSAGNQSTQSDMGVKDSGDNLKQDSNPRVIDTNTKPATGATPPNNVNQNGLPGLGAQKPSMKGTK